MCFLAPMIGPDDTEVHSLDIPHENDPSMSMVQSVPSTPRKSPVASSLLKPSPDTINSNGKRPTPTAASPSTPKTRTILQPIHKNSIANFFGSFISRKKPLERRASATDIPTSFVGTPIKRRKRVNSIERL
jgi:hypothetical protein